MMAVYIISTINFGELLYNFKSIKDGFRISAEGQNINTAIKSIDLFVELFSN